MPPKNTPAEEKPKTHNVKFYLLLLGGSACLSLGLETSLSFPFGFLGAFLCLLVRPTSLWQVFSGTLFFSLSLHLFAFPWLQTGIQNMSGVWLSYLFFGTYSLFGFGKIFPLLLLLHFISKEGWERQIFFISFFWVPGLVLLGDFCAPQLFPVFWGDFFRSESLLLGLVGIVGVEVFGAFHWGLASALALGLQRRSAREKLFNLTWVLLGFLFLLLLSWAHLGQDYKPKGFLRVAVLQPMGKLGRAQDPDPSFLIRENTEQVLRLGLSLTEKNFDLLVLPESAVPFVGTDPEFLDSYSETFHQVISGLAERVQAPILYNEIRKKPGLSKNTLTLYDPHTKTTSHRDKRRLFPFGESLPLVGQFPFLAKLFPETSFHTQGKERKALELSKASALPLVCFEDLFSQDLLEFPPTDFLVNLTNDGWFESEREARQHAGSLALRALESGLPALRVSFHGPSQVLDPFGRVLSQWDWGRSGIVLWELPLGKLPTKFSPELLNGFRGVFWIACLAHGVFFHRRAFGIPKIRKNMLLR